MQSCWGTKNAFKTATIKCLARPIRFKSKFLSLDIKLKDADLENGALFNHHYAIQPVLLRGWFPFSLIVTVVHHVNWCLWGVVLARCAQWSVHGSLTKCFACRLSNTNGGQTVIVGAGTSLNGAS